MNDQEQVPLIAYRDGRLTEINSNDDLFLKKLIEADRKEVAQVSAPYVDYVGEYISRMGYSSLDTVGASTIITHNIYKNGRKFLIILANVDEPLAFVKLESPIEYMDFCRDYLLPLMEMDSRSTAWLSEQVENKK